MDVGIDQRAGLGGINEKMPMAQILELADAGL